MTDDANYCGGRLPSLPEPLPPHSRGSLRYIKPSRPLCSAAMAIPRGTCIFNCCPLRGKYRLTRIGWSTSFSLQVVHMIRRVQPATVHLFHTANSLQNITSIQT